MHWIALFVKTNEVIYFDSFGIEHIPKEINKFIDNEQSSTAKPSSLEHSAKARNKKLKRIYLEYKHMIQLCVDIFV